MSKEKSKEEIQPCCECNSSENVMVFSTYIFRKKIWCVSCACDGDGQSVFAFSRQKAIQKWNEKWMRKNHYGWKMESKKSERTDGSTMIKKGVVYIFDGVKDSWYPLSDPASMDVLKRMNGTTCTKENLELNREPLTNRFQPVPIVTPEQTVQPPVPAPVTVPEPEPEPEPIPEPEPEPEPMKCIYCGREMTQDPEHPDLDFHFSCGQEYLLKQMVRLGTERVPKEQLDTIQTNIDEMFRKLGQ